MTLLAPFVERRATARLRETPLRRRNGHPRPVGSSGLTPYTRERRKSTLPFDMAATLELNLDRYPTKPGMLTFLQNLLYNAESGLDAREPTYVDALRRAVEVVRSSDAPVDAAATMLGYQTFIYDHPGAPRD